MDVIKKLANNIHISLSKCNPSVMGEMGLQHWKYDILVIIKEVYPDFDFSDFNDKNQLDNHPVLNLLLHTSLFDDNRGLKLISEMYGIGFRSGKIILGPNITRIIPNIDSGVNTNADVIKIFEEVSRSSKNPLQGTQTQIFVLHYLINQFWYLNFKTSLYNGTNKEKWLYYASLIDIFNSMGSAHDDDLDIRTHMIRKHVEKTRDIDTIVLMDGHGRTISRVAQIFNSLPPDRELNLLIYELDYYNDLWHKNTTPLDTSLNANIFEAFTDDKFLHGNSFVYVNFSGLSGQGDTMKDTIETIYHTNKNLLENIMISFACVMKGINPCNKTHFELLHFGFTPLTTRSTAIIKNNQTLSIKQIKQGDFVTMGLPILRDDEAFEESIPLDTVKELPSMHFYLTNPDKNRKIKYLQSKGLNFNPSAYAKKKFSESSRLAAIDTLAAEPVIDTPAAEPVMDTPAEPTEAQGPKRGRDEDEEDNRSNRQKGLGKRKKKKTKRRKPRKHSKPFKKKKKKKETKRKKSKSKSKSKSK